MSGKIKEKGMEILFLACALASIAAVAVICLFLFMGGIPAIGEIGAGEFLLGRKWAPQDVPASFGIFPMILGSVYVTGGAILLGVPVGILAAVFLARFCPRPAYRVLGPAVQLMAGIPSIVYGLFGMLFFVTALHWGFSLLSGACTLAIMILPLIMRTTEEALKSVPDSFREASFGLGAGRLRTVTHIVLPPAMSGILAGVILAIGRVVGETAALIYTAGTVADWPKGVMSSGRTLAVHMYVLSGEGLHVSEASATAVVLLVIVVGMNALSAFAAKKLTRG